MEKKHKLHSKDPLQSPAMDRQCNFREISRKKNTQSNVYNYNAQHASFQSSFKQKKIIYKWLFCLYYNTYTLCGVKKGFYCVIYSGENSVKNWQQQQVKFRENEVCSWKNLHISVYSAFKLLQTFLAPLKPNGVIVWKLRKFAW